MKVLVFGAEGMLGSELMRALPDAYGTTRYLSRAERLLPCIDITDVRDLHTAFDWARPEVVINCAGMVKSECEKSTAYEISKINAYAPHNIARVASLTGCRVVHISTDCVFSGSSGSRTEEDPSDAVDLYGRSKKLGELVDHLHCVTLRTSFIGRDRKHKRGLLEWLLTQTESVPGYANAMWSGLSTPELSRVIGKVILDTSMSGLYHVSGPVISKADLLEILARSYKLSCRIRSETEPHIDRTLNGSRFNRTACYEPPSWEAMA